VKASKQTAASLLVAVQHTHDIGNRTHVITIIQFLRCYVNSYFWTPYIFVTLVSHDSANKEYCLIGCDAAHQWFTETCCFHHQGRRTIALETGKNVSQIRWQIYAVSPSCISIAMLSWM